MTDNNPTLQTFGSIAHLGSRLSVYWGYVLALLVGIILAHLLLVLGSMRFYRQDAAGASNVELRRLRASA